MPGEVRLSLKELDELIAEREATGCDATELRHLLGEVTGEEKPAKQVNDDDYIAELHSKSSVEYGTDLECMICHGKFDQLISGTCGACFRQWALSTKKR